MSKKAREFWVMYNQGYNIDSVVSMKPDLNENRFSSISEAMHVIEYSALEQERAKSQKLLEALYEAKRRFVFYPLNEDHITEEMDKHMCEAYMEIKEAIDEYEEGE